nr:transposase [Arthrobacter zhaoguopingii]
MGHDHQRRLGGQDTSVPDRPRRERAASRPAHVGPTPGPQKSGVQIGYWVSPDYWDVVIAEKWTKHLGHERGWTPLTLNTHNGTRLRTVLTELGPVRTEVPRGRDSAFEPVIVLKRKRRLDGID